MEEEEHIEFEEEYTTIYRKTKRTRNKRHKKKRQADDCDNDAVKADIKLNPFLVGTKTSDAYQPNKPEEARQKSDFVQQLVKDTLNEYKGTELPVIRPSAERLFLGECEYDDDLEEVDTVAELKTQSIKSARRFVKTGRKGLDRFRRVVDFVILAKQVFTCRRTVSLNRRDSILFFMDTEVAMDTGDPNELKFDVTSFKGLGQKSRTAAVKSCLDVHPYERTDAHVNHMVHMMKNFGKFSKYPKAVQTGICKRGWYARFESSKVIVKEGCRAEFYYLILSGVAVYRDVEGIREEATTNRTRPVASFLHPGDTLGEREILADRERPATVVCREPIEVLGVDRDTLLDIFQAAGGLGSVEFLRTIPELTDFPLELLQTYHFSLAVHYYRRGTVIVKNSNESEWIYIVRSGSCQVYKAIKDGAKSNKDTCPANTCSTSSSKPKPAGNGSQAPMFPFINKNKNELLKSSSHDSIDDVFEKSRKKQKRPTVERAMTMLPIINPSKTALLQNPVSSFHRPQTPPLADSHNKENSNTATNKHKKSSSKPSQSVKTRHKSDSNDAPESFRLNRYKTSLCETPDSTRNSRLGHFSSPSSESLLQLTLRKNSNPSDSESGGISRSRKTLAETSLCDTTGRRRHRLSNSSESLSPEVSGAAVYVRLGIVSENGVFGFHPLLYNNMPNLSLVSNGAECVLISKQFLKDHLTNTLAHILRCKIPPYPNSGQLRTALDDQANWDNYREKVVGHVLK